MKSDGLPKFIVLVCMNFQHTTAFCPVQRNAVRTPRLRLRSFRRRTSDALNSHPTALLSQRSWKRSVALHLSNNLRWTEVWIDQGSAVETGSCHAPSGTKPSTGGDASASSVGIRIQEGKSVVMLRDLISGDECRDLAQRCIHVADNSQKFELEYKASPSPMEDDTEKTTSIAANIPTLVRLPTQAAARRADFDKITCTDPLPDYIDYRVQQILQGVCQAIDACLPSLPMNLLDAESLTVLFHQSPSLMEQSRTPLDDELMFSAREPAINVYSAPGGEFLPHKDGEALTILLPLSSPEQDFEGGGTAFWSPSACGEANSNANQQDPASLVLKPLAGTALLFGGTVTHAGLPVTSGRRVVLVCSLTRRRQRSSTGSADILETGEGSTSSEHTWTVGEDSATIALDALLQNAAADWHDKWTGSELNNSCRTALDRDVSTDGAAN